MCGGAALGRAHELSVVDVRVRFPALHVTDDGRRRTFFDTPCGTQVCADAIARMTQHLAGGTADAGRAFATSCADALARAARGAVADLIGGAADGIGFGLDMTTLTLAPPRARTEREARRWDRAKALERDANVTPWALAAANRGVAVRGLLVPSPHP